MNLHSLHPAPGSITSRKRIARGGSRGGTSGRGHNGAQSRSGYKSKKGFEGGQMPLKKRVPTFGFKNPFRVEYKSINFYTIRHLIEDKNITDITPTVLYSNGLIQKNGLFKILGTGELSKKTNFVTYAISKSARLAIEKLGGKIEILNNNE